MNRLHARYPFLAVAREAVDEADVDLAALVERENSPTVERALERVETAIGEGHVGTPARDARTELLSYPVARVVVSVVDDDELTRAYAAAEAESAHARFTDDFERTDRKSESDWRVDLDRLLREFDLASGVVDDGDRVRVDVGPYLRLAGTLERREWRLVHRDLTDGEVPLQRTELYDLLREAVRERVAEGLPVAVPEVIESRLGESVERIERALADTAPPEGIDVVAPDLFPPCVTDLIERARSDEELPAHSAFSLVSFLTGIGLDAEEAATLCECDPESFAHRASRIAGETGTEYPPPSCATMAAYGDCADDEDPCGEFDHPTTYYADRLEGADPTDWRERKTAKE
jgi:DNA primase large subunit